MNAWPFAFLLVLAVLASGCISGQTLKRQAAEQSSGNITFQAAPQNEAVDVYDDMPEAECTCRDSVTTCPDGFNAACRNECSTGSCSRCLPSCAGHQCKESWFCGEWKTCSNGSQSRICVDSSFCNRTALKEMRACEADQCSSSSECPAEAGCTVYFCEGQPRKCKPYTRIPCCGDGKCDGSSDCASDCPPAPCNCAQTQCPACGAANETNRTESNASAAYYSNVSITNISFRTPEYAEISNTGNASQNMANWTLMDAANHSFVFPYFVLAPNAYVRVHTGNGTDNSTDIFWKRDCPRSSAQCIWNDGGDNATLWDDNSIRISFYSY